MKKAIRTNRHKNNDVRGSLRAGPVHDAEPQKRSRDVAALTAAANAGDAKAMLDLACAYDDGEGVERDLQQAAAWCTKAATAGDPDAMYRLSCAYAQGLAWHATCRRRRRGARGPRQRAYP